MQTLPKINVEAYKDLDIEYKVLDKGYVKLIDFMGSDASVVRAARQSTTGDLKSYEEDIKLLSYLYRNRHCYHPEMEVLTNSGWKKWKDCDETECFVVPNPFSKTTTFETVEVKKFPYKGIMKTVETERFKFSVTPEHRVWYKGKYEHDFHVEEAKNMKHWGNLELMIKYKITTNTYKNFPSEMKGRLLGFYLGDGSYSSKNTISFHLKKKRKIEYLESILNYFNYQPVLKIEYKKREDKKGAVTFTLKTPEWLKQILGENLEARSQFKGFEKSKLETLDMNWIQGLFDGLVNSDGSIKSDRNQICFSSMSSNLIEIFEACGSFLGYDVHRTKKLKFGERSTAYTNNSRTSLEFRDNHFKDEEFDGEVFCATTSSGLLFVRGGNDTFAFVCGNSTPFEMVEVVFELKVPMVIGEQILRHRTFSYNKFSGRYSQMPDEYYKYEYSKKVDDLIGEMYLFPAQDQKNKQGSQNLVEVYPEAVDGSESWNVGWDGGQEEAFKDYKSMIDNGVSKEIARLNLPLSTYTKMWMKGNLRNFMHFLELRMDSHAQWEIQQYANKMHEIISKIAPESMKLFDRYKYKLVDTHATA